MLESLQKNCDVFQEVVCCCVWLCVVVCRCVLLYVVVCCCVLLCVVVCCCVSLCVAVCRCMLLCVVVCHHHDNSHEQHHLHDNSWRPRGSYVYKTRLCQIALPLSQGTSATLVSEPFTFPCVLLLSLSSCTSLQFLIVFMHLSTIPHCLHALVYNSSLSSCTSLQFLIVFMH